MQITQNFKNISQMNNIATCDILLRDKGINQEIYKAKSRKVLKLFYK